ncbi:MAG: carboxylating nicotinate-nucleotide diphosphorylase [Gammaproteobacteria bacterium]|nr:carboxylating nicotinate-nucleotide diphosphorylase [Gammaproteobacteria bacterium]
MHKTPLALPQDIEETVARALAEDVGAGDLTAVLIPAQTRAEAVVISREPAVLCGCAWFDAVFHRLDPAVEVTWNAWDGDGVTAGQILCRLRGPARALLTGERTALNFLQTLSGTATAARRHAEAVKGTQARVLDTRKTLPGLRGAQKYAVRCGGCDNHRMGLYDAVLIKENHILAAGSITRAVQRARAAAPGKTVEVEVETLEQVQEALAAGADVLLLDNFDLQQMRAAVAIAAGRVKLEASGGITLDTLRRVAETGVDYISIGALTKDVRAIDLSMRFTPAV